MFKQGKAISNNKYSQRFNKKKIMKFKVFIFLCLIATSILICVQKKPPPFWSWMRGEKTRSGLVPHFCGEMQLTQKLHSPQPPEGSLKGICTARVQWKKTCPSTLISDMKFSILSVNPSVSH